MQVQGYKIEDLIHRGKNTMIYHGVRESDKKPVIFKSLRPEHVSKTQAARLKHEFELLNGLSEKHINKAICFVSDQDLPILVSEYDEEFISLDLWIRDADNVSVADYLRVALEIADAISELHDQQILYKDLKPANLLVNPRTYSVKLIDFGIASQGVTETANSESLNELQGSLAYISPEQTGRMNRDVDYRSDYYSLGVTLYEMLTGVTPFLAQDSMEWIYAHIALTPAIPHDVDPLIPEALSNIVMKLLSKDAHDRYQSHHGLSGDLQNCLDEITAKGSIKPFPLGLHECKGVFSLPQKLYGREEHVTALMHAFFRCSAAKPQLFLVHGHSGLGKTALINEIYKPITTMRGTFLKGRYYLLRRAEPFLGMGQALNEWVHQALQLPKDELKELKQDLQQSLGQMAVSLFRVIPDLHLLLDHVQPENLENTENNEGLFTHAFMELIYSIASPEHPLTLVLDDLQWCDPPSLELLQRMLTDPKLKHILVIASYRDDEVEIGHPLFLMLEQVHSVGLHAAKEVYLAPLGRDQIAQMLSDTLNENRESLYGLADIVLEMTSGNPFFIKEYLSLLYAKKLLRYDVEQELWCWEASAIKYGALTTNLVDLLVAKLEELPEATLELIKLSACLGREFDLRYVALLSGKTISEASIELWHAVLKGLIKPLNDQHHLSRRSVRYKNPCESEVIQDTFVHDKVYEAAYSLVPYEEKKLKHLAIGRLLLQETTLDGLEKRIFYIVSHLNVAQDLLRGIPEKINLVSLNLMAARKAMASIAYNAAAKYLSNCLGLLPNDASSSYYQLYMEVNVEVIKCAFHTRDFDCVQEFGDIIKAQAKSEVEKIIAYHYRIRTLYEKADFKEAWTETGEALAILGVQLNGSPSAASLIPNLYKYRKLKKIDQAFLEALPEATNRKIILAQELIADALTSTYFYDKTAFAILAFKSVELALTYGRTEYTPRAFAIIGYVGRLVLGDYLWGSRLAREALNTAKADPVYYKKSLGPIQAKHVLFVAHMQESREEYRLLANAAYKNCLEQGFPDFVTSAIASLAQTTRSQYSFSTQLETIRDYIVIAQRHQNKLVVSSLQLLGQQLQSLAGTSKSFEVLSGDICDSEVILEQATEDKLDMVVSAVHSNRGYLYYHARNYGAAQKEFEAAIAQSSLTGIYDLTVRLNFYLAMSKMKNITYPLNSKSNIKRLHRGLKKEFKEVRKSVKYQFNNQHLEKTLMAEEAALRGDRATAMDLFDQAIAMANEFGIAIDILDVLRHTIDFYLDIGKDKIAYLYLQEALSVADRSGAVGILRLITYDYIELISTMQNESADSRPATQAGKLTVHNSIPLGSLDINHIRKASNALAGDVHLGSLLNKLLHICMENSGAQRGALLIPLNDQLIVQAIGDADTEVFNTLQNTPLDQAKDLPIGLIEYVARSKRAVVLVDATENQQYCDDPHIKASQVKSLLCGPMLLQGRLRAIIYMENRSNSGVFDDDRLGTLELISTQASISIENASLYTSLEKRNKQVVGLLQATKDMACAEDKASACLVAAEFLCTVDKAIDFKRAALYIISEDCEAIIDKGIKEQGIEKHDIKKRVMKKELVFPISTNHRIAQTPVDGDAVENSISHATEQTIQSVLKSCISPSLESDTQGSESANDATSQVMFRNKQLYLPIYSSQKLQGVLELGEYTDPSGPDASKLDAYMGVVQSLALTLENISSEAAKSQYILESDRLKQEFIATISHELRTPLNGIQGSIELMKMDDSHMDYDCNLRTIEQSSQMMTGLVGSIIDFVSVESGTIDLKISTRNLARQLEKLVQESQELCDAKGVRLEFSSSIDEYNIETDSEKVQKIAGYLLSNAVKFTGSGSISFDLSLKTNSQGSDLLELVVRDTGIGIAEEVKSDVFTLFKQGDGSFTRQFGGLGIGLTLAKRLAKLLKGDIEFTSEEGKGSEFSAHIPVITVKRQPELVDETSKNNKASQQGELRSSQPFHVLIVEDNAVNQKVLRRMLLKLNCQVSTCDDGLQAVNWCQDNEADLIFMDCQMPILDGFEATRQIRAGDSHNRHIPIIAVTANVTEQDKENCFDAGMNDFLSKPIRKAIIERALNEWVGERLQQ